MTSYQDIIYFWFEEAGPDKWWKKDPDFDQLIRDRFLSVYDSACRCDLSPWREQPQGRLAEIIVLDQFSRNLFRDTPQAFAQDALSLALAQETIAVEADKKIPAEQRAFLYMTFMHSESAIIHEQAVKILSAPGLEKNLEFELKHKAIIDRFGRYPHRNTILGRTSTAEELEFLKIPGSSF